LKEGLTLHGGGLVRTRVVEFQGRAPRYILLDVSLDLAIASGDDPAPLLELCQTPPIWAVGYVSPPCPKS
jgi:hypothetical protein